MLHLPLQINFDAGIRSIVRGILPALFAAIIGLVCTPAWAKAPPRHPAQHHAALRPHFAQLPHRSSHHHRGGYHRGGYHRSGGIHVNYYRGYHRTGYHRHRGNRNSQMAWMARMYQQQYQMMVRQRQAELKAFLAAFDTNHNGVIDGKETGPAEKYLRERRLGIIPPLAIASANRGKK